MTQVFVERELLTDQKMKSLFGANYKNIVSFNFDAGAWNRSSYLGFSIGNQNIDTRDAIEMRRMLELDERVKNFEIVATVTMSVPDELYPGTHNVGRDVKYKRARNIVGTVVLRNKATGKILKPNNTWFGVEKYEKMSAAAFYCADSFAYQVARNSQIRDRFVAGIISDYQR